MNPRIATATIAAGLLCTWDQPDAKADPYAFEGSITPAQTLSNVYFVFATGFCSGTVYAHEIAESLPGGVTTDFSFWMDMNPADREHSTHEPYGEFQTIFALYDGANDGVTIGYNTTAASKILATNSPPQWTDSYLPSYFSDSDTVGSQNVGYTEADIADLLRTGAITNWHPGASFFFGYPVLDPPRFANRPNDPSFTLLNLSSPTFGGSAFATETIPEPTSMALVLVAGTGLMLLRRRRT